MKSLSLLWAALFVFVSAPVCMADQIGNLASEMATAIGESGKKAIAVADFTDLEGQNTKLGRFLAEEFSVALAASGQGFQVIDRLHLKSLIKEHELSESGIIDTTTAQKLGNIAGVEALITGTLTPFGDTIRVTAKILDTETARIIGAMTGDLPKTGAFAKLVESEIMEVQQATQQARRAAAATGEKGPSPAPQAIQSKTMEGFAFYLQSCVRSSNTLKFAFLVESVEKDQKLLVHKGGTRFFDNFGNEFGPAQIELGNKSLHYGTTGSLLIAKIPTRMVLTFKNVNPKASYVPLLEVNLGAFKFQMRDIEITGG